MLPAVECVIMDTPTERHDEIRSIATRVGSRLRDRNETVSTAESLTGGMISAELTAIPGSSDYFTRGFVTYAYDAKRSALAVPRELLDEHGAVAEAVATRMAQSARDIADTTWAISVTGIAGPDGGTETKPVGLVYIAIAYAGPWGTQTSAVTADRFVFDGDRQSVRHQTVYTALESLENAITRSNPDE